MCETENCKYLKYPYCDICGLNINILYQECMNKNHIECRIFKNIETKNNEIIRLKSAIKTVCYFNIENTDKCTKIKTCNLNKCPFLKKI
jgi:hypothetical protein